MGSPSTIAPAIHTPVLPIHSWYTCMQEYCGVPQQQRILGTGHLGCEHKTNTQQSTVNSYTTKHSTYTATTCGTQQALGTALNVYARHTRTHTHDQAHVTHRRH